MLNFIRLHSALNHPTEGIAVQLGTEDGFTLVIQNENLAPIPVELS
jgi:hypothetical protein